MPGMYPENEILEIFNETVLYPGVDPNTGKFTNGDFNDPLIKPSYIPAETFNLVIDNLESCIKELGLKPNNKEPDQLIRALKKWVGRGGYLDEFNFETSKPTQQQLTDYALSQITTLTNKEEIFNYTKIPNKYDGHVWILTNTQETEPPVFEWSDNGPGIFAPLNENYGGYAKGAAPTDPPEYIRAVSNGKGKLEIDIALLSKTFFLIAHPVNSLYMTVAPDESTTDQMADKYGGTWARWGAGRVPVSLDLNDPLFNAVTNADGTPKTGGSKEVTLTAQQSGLVEHVHGITDPSHQHYGLRIDESRLGFPGSGNP